MPKLARILLSEIDEPQLPVRISMSERKMQELMESMSNIGLLQPIGLKTANGRYEIEFGHRRFLAARTLKWNDIPAIIFAKKELADGAAMIAENVEREDITAAEEAVLFAQAQEQLNLDEEGLCKRFRRSPHYIGTRLQLLRADPEVYRAVQERKITFAVARQLNTCEDEPHRRYLLDAAIRSEAGAKVVSSWIAQYRAQSITPTNVMEPTPPGTGEPTPVSTGIECAICGGYRDPYNLVPIYIHKWELAKILQVMRSPQEPTASDNTEAAAND